MDVGRQKLGKNCDFTLSIATLSHEMDVGRQKLRKSCDFEASRATLSHEMDVGRQKLRKNCEFDLVPRNPYARNGRWTSKTEEKLRLWVCQSQPLRTKWTLDVKNWGKIATLSLSIATLTHEMDVGRQKLKKNCDFSLSIATLTHEMDVGRQKLGKNCDFTLLFATLTHEMDVGR